jgi:hypothetical protein
MSAIHVLPVEVVRAAHHAIPLEVLSAHHSWFSSSLTLGDLIVGAGTMLLAVFTWKLGRATYALDERNAARERKRRERQVRGVARLIFGELGMVKVSLAEALEETAWRFFYASPHGAWDREGAVVAETLPEDEAEALIAFMSKLTAWEEIVAQARAGNPKLQSLRLGQEEQEAVAGMSTVLSDVQRYLRTLAYPDARDLEPDPDGLLAYKKERRAARWKRLRSFKDR